MKSGTTSGPTDEHLLQIWISHSLTFSSTNNHQHYLLAWFRVVYNGHVQHIFTVCHSRQINVATWFLVFPIDIENKWTIESINIYICLLLLILMLWHRQAIFESKGDKLSSSAESRIQTHQGLRHQIASRLNAHWQTDWAIEDQAKNLNLTARLYDQRAFSPLDPTAVWHSHLALATYMFVVVNFDALAQASDFRIARRQVVFLCWEQDSNPSGSQTPNRQQAECLLTNRLSYRGSS